MFSIVHLVATLDKDKAGVREIVQGWRWICNMDIEHRPLGGSVLDLLKNYNSNEVGLFVVVRFERP